MSETTDVVPPSDNSDAEQAGGPRRTSSGLHQALGWVGIVAGGLFIVAAIFFSGFFLSWSEHMGHMAMSHAGMGHESKDCCADMKPGDHMPKPGAMMGSEMMGPHSGR